MIIDLKYLIPVVMPFAVVLLLRALCALAGVPWTESVSAVAVLFSVLVSVVAGTGIVVCMADAKLHWRVRIGGGGGDQ